MQEQGGRSRHDAEGKSRKDQGEVIAEGFYRELS